ncbi:MAG TPA: hypothetical protein H9836_03180 [Candidatus Nocardiopsis merdipullorum]|nr:hypothetical protein [Candidatus Nocardiopsis merdipullorum]
MSTSKTQEGLSLPGEAGFCHTVPGNEKTQELLFRGDEAESETEQEPPEQVRGHVAGLALITVLAGLFDATVMKNVFGVLRRRA